MPSYSFRHVLDNSIESQMTPNLYRLKYIKNGEIRLGNLAKLPLILYELDKHLERGMYCIVVDDRNVEYKPPIPQALKYPSPKPIRIDAIAAYLNKPENVEKRRQARLEDTAMWEKLRNS